MTKQHLNDDNRLLRCTAQTPESCDYSGNPHFKSIREGEEYLQKAARQEAGGSSFGEPFRKRDSKLNSRQYAQDVDTKLSKLYDELEEKNRRARFNLNEVHRAVGDKKDYRSDTWGMPDEDVIERASKMPHQPRHLDNYLSESFRINEINAEMRELNEKFKAQGGWNRAFIVNNSNGHVHSTMDCSTCNKGNVDTQFQWLPEYSGADESEIVESAGWRACTVCFPSAPIGTPGTLPSKMMTEEEKAKAAERRKRDDAAVKKKSAAAANAPTIDGSTIKVHESYSIGRNWDGRVLEPHGKELKTERAAAMWYVDTWVPAGVEKFAGDVEVADQYNQRHDELEDVVHKLAEKRGVNVDELRKELQAKALKKHGYRWGM